MNSVRPSNSGLQRAALVALASSVVYPPSRNQVVRCDVRLPAPSLKPSVRRRVVVLLTFAVV
jgi:hypothetical protein